LNKDFGRANNLTNNIYDPVSKEPDFKFAAVQVEKYRKPRQKIIVVGAGAAAYRFLNTYRELNQEDEIHVFSKEKYAFYNRVLLPEYTNGHLDWEALLKFRNQQEQEELDFRLHVENEITAIDRTAKTVTDAQGVQHRYDVLLMATGSRAFVPPDTPLHLPGIFTLRSRDHADQLKSHLPPGGHVLIVGGGLLGLELAAALREIDMQVTIIQLGSRLMERQLDLTASTLLQEKIEEMGIKLYMNDQVQLIESKGQRQPVQARLKSGKALACHAVVYAVGTRPNIEVVRESGVDCARGVKVNDYLQTSDPAIFAVGEIAEHRESLHGFTAAAEQQADTVARFISGDLLSIYEGSVSMNILKFSNLDLCSVGMAEIPHGAAGYEEILFIDRAKAFYKKCIIHQDRLVGAILMGDKSEFAEFKGLIENKTELSEKRMQLLRSGNPGKAVVGEVVCSCGNVGRGNLEAAIKDGCDDFKQLCQETGAGLGCGSCKPEVKSMLDKLLQLA
jgi:ferredoxin-nitrate reductase